MSEAFKLEMQEVLGPKKFFYTLSKNIQSRPRALLPRQRLLQIEFSQISERISQVWGSGH